MYIIYESSFPSLKNTKEVILLKRKLALSLHSKLVTEPIVHYEVWSHNFSSSAEKKEKIRLCQNNSTVKHNLPNMYSDLRIQYLIRA